MRIVMVKKRLADGRECRKCEQVTGMLQRRGYQDRIDEIIWADESDPASPGMQLAAKHGIAVAPFFLVTDDQGVERAYVSAITFMQDCFQHTPTMLERIQDDMSRASVAPTRPLPAIDVSNQPIRRRYFPTIRIVPQPMRPPALPVGWPKSSTFSCSTIDRPATAYFPPLTFTPATVTVNVPDPLWSTSMLPRSPGCAPVRPSFVTSPCVV